MFRGKITTRCLYLLLVSLLFLPGCGWPPFAVPPPERLLLLIILDLSGSIEQEALVECFEALRALPRQLQRGNALAIIPVTSDALAETSGRIRRFELAPRREAFDDDLSQFEEDLRAVLEQMRATAVAQPAQRSDILGAVELAVEELATRRSQFQRLVVVLLSDFLVEDKQRRFKHDAALARRATAEKLAAALAQAAPQPGAFQQVNVYLGWLRSHELKQLTEERRAAIRAFWSEYFRVRGAAQVVSATDGPARLNHFLQTLPKELQTIAETGLGTFDAGMSSFKE
jgi:hypothetical protein